MTEDEFVQLLLAGQAMDQAGPASPFVSLAPKPTAPMSAYEPGPWGPNPEASRAGYLNPEDYIASQGEIRSGESAFPQDPLKPAYQGAADIGASFLAPPVASGTQLANDPSIQNATQFGVDAVMAASPLASANQTAMRLLGVTGGGTAAAAANDIFNTPAMAARKKKGGSRQQQEAAPPPPIERSAGPTNEAGRIISSDPEIQQIDSQIDFYNRVLQDSTKPKSTRDGAAQQLTALNKSRSDAVSRLTEGMQPFNKAYPTLSGMWPFVQMGAGTVTGMATKGIADGLVRRAKGPWRKAVTQGEKALARGDLGKATNNARAAEYYQGKADPTSKWNIAKEAGYRALPATAGATVGAELSVLPDRYNLNNAPADSEAYKNSKKNLDNPLWSMGVGGVMGGLGAATGQHLTPTKRTSYPLERSKAFVDSVKAGGKDFNTDALAASRINETRQSAILKSYLPRRFKFIDWQNPAVPHAKKEAVIKHMMSHPKKPPGAVHFNPVTGRYVDATGKMLKFGE